MAQLTMTLYLTGRLEHPVGVWEVITSNWFWNWDYCIVPHSHVLKIYIILFLALYINHLLCVTTPISPITFGWLNWHMMDASDRKSFWFFSLEPGWNEIEDQKCNIRFLTFIVYDIIYILTGLALSSGIIFYTLVVWEFINSAFSS